MKTINSNKGFSLIEVLVTVGLVGVLVGIAVPSYNKYKQNTSTVAMKADMSNAAKTYNAYSAINATFCADWKEVGLARGSVTSFDGSTLYKKMGFVGFETGATDCPSVNASGQVLHFKSKAGDTSSTTQDQCTGSGGIWQAKSSTSGDECVTNAANTFSASPSSCQVGVNTFKFGATTEIANISSSAKPRMLTITEEGIINDNTSLDCI